MKARYHNARICTLDDVDYWIGCIYTGEGPGRRFVDVSTGLDTEDEVVEWCKAELRRRGETGPLEITDTTTKENTNA